MSNKPTHRVLLSRDGKGEKLIDVGALWPGKNDSFSGDVELIVGKFRLVILPNREKAEAGQDGAA